MSTSIKTRFQAVTPFGTFTRRERRTLCNEWIDRYQRWLAIAARVAA